MAKLYKQAQVISECVSLYPPKAQTPLPSKPTDDDVVRQQIKKEAFQKGYEQGKTKTQHQLSELKKQLDDLLASIPLALAQSRLELQTEIADILWSIIESYFIEKALSKGALELQINQILTQINAKQTVELHLHPKDILLLQKEAFHLQPTHLNGLKIKSDERLTLGGCVIKTEHGLFDASLEKQVDRLKQRLLEIRQGRAHESMD